MGSRQLSLEASTARTAAEVTSVGTKLRAGTLAARASGLDLAREQQLRVHLFAPAATRRMLC